MTTTTTVGPRPSVHHPRRALLSVAVAAALAVGAGAGAAAVSLTSSDGTTSHQTNPAAMPVTKIDAQALWDQLAMMPANERDNVVVGLSPDVRARLQAIGEDIAVAAENH
jgi:hypothetical protein